MDPSIRPVTFSNSVTGQCNTEIVALLLVVHESLLSTYLITEY